MMEKNEEKISDFVPEEITTEVKEKIFVEKRKKSNKKIIAVIGCLLFVIVTAICAFVILNPTDKTTEATVKNNLFSDNLVKIYQDEKYGYADKTGNIVIAAQFDSCGAFSEGYAWVSQENKEGEKKYGFIDTTGNLAIDYLYDNAYNFNEGLALVKSKEKYGYIDYEGNVVIPIQYEDAWGFSEGLAKVCVKEKWGYINKSGETVIGCLYDNAYDFSDGVAVVGVDKNEDTFYGIINTLGEYIIQPNYEDISTKTDGLHYARLNSKYGFLDEQGNVVIGFQFDEVDAFSEGLSAVEVGDLIGFIDKEGNYVIKLQYSEAGAFSEGLAAVKVGEKYGYIDKTGKIIISAQFDNASDFSNGVARVEVNGNYGYIDKTGNYVINIQYPRVTDFYDDGFAIIVTGDKKYQIIDKAGVSVGTSFDLISNQSLLCVENECFQNASYDSEYCYDHKPNTSSSTSSYYCKWSGCYNRALYSGYCYSHYNFLLQYL